MAARVREVVWVESARAALDEVIAYIAQDSQQAAVQVLDAALHAAASLSTLPERGRIVPELNNSSIRETFVFQYRLMYRVEDRRWLSSRLCMARATSPSDDRTRIRRSRARRLTDEWSRRAKRSCATMSPSRAAHSGIVGPTERRNGQRQEPGPGGRTIHCARSECSRNGAVLVAMDDPGLAPKDLHV